MAVLPIIVYPDPVLKRPCAPVTQFDSALETLAADMAETMYAAPGVGLAANQVGISKRLFIIDVGEEETPSGLHVFVNPEIVATEGTVQWEEGCLSFPDILVDVTRHARVVVRASDVHGAPFEMDVDGLFAIAVQHELDHLNGVSLADKVSYLRKKMMIQDLQRRKRSMGR